MRRLAALGLVLAGLLAAPAVASAHPLGNFTINRYSLIQPGPHAVQVTFVVDMAEIPTFQALGSAERPDRARAWAVAQVPAWTRGVHLAIDGRPVNLRPLASRLAVRLRRGQGGLRCLRAVLPLVADVGGGPHIATFADDTYGDRVGWKEIVLRPAAGVVLTRSTASTHDVSHMLRHYPAGLLSTPLDVRRASFAFRPGSGPSADVAAPTPSGGIGVGTWGSGFTDLVSHHRLTPGFLALALLLAAAWGALHALTPGHGKSIVAAYLVGARGTSRHAVLLGLTVTLTHTAAVLALGLVTLELSAYVVPESLYPWLSLLSGLVVAWMGATIATRRLRARHRHHHGHDHHHHGPGGHSHLPPGADGAPVTARSLLALGVSGGMLPCPSALVVMLGAIALHRVAFGLVLVVAFSTGLAATLTGIGLLVVHARRLVERVPLPGGAARAIPVLSAAVIAVLGVALTLQAFRSFPAGAPPAAYAAGAAVAAAFVAGTARRPLAHRLAHARGRAHEHDHELPGGEPAGA